MRTIKTIPQVYKKHQHLQGKKHKKLFLQQKHTLCPYLSIELTTKTLKPSTNRYNKQHLLKENMSNIAEFDVPDQPQPNSQTENTKENTPTVKPKPKNIHTDKTPPPKINPTILLTTIGWIALTFAALKTYTTFNPTFTYPLQTELTPYTIPLMLTAYITFKISTRNPLSKLGLISLYIILAIYTVNKIYTLITTGIFNWE